MLKCSFQTSRSRLKVFLEASNIYFKATSRLLLAKKIPKSQDQPSNLAFQELIPKSSENQSHQSAYFSPINHRSKEACEWKRRADDTPWKRPPASEPPRQKERIIVVVSDKWFHQKRHREYNRWWPKWRMPTSYILSETRTPGCFHSAITRLARTRGRRRAAARL